ncbi:p115 like vesicle tethering protein [Apodospora peruviana]|uniref:P115 like vesicle tethering protein n=1 Tax=Apodospora peruviana TaxID=516989 RepID=A0AAE0HYE5_9PEZI|nr:p115 like vesicle tethering protein [Apodospora peruviana]
MFSTITAAPAKQSVSETIAVLSGRLSSATLLEDRRAAILGLRSFSKQYPASVASGALRSLIGSLSKDGEDVDTVKVVMETLLMLFNPNKDSPEASEEIALWLADEFTQRQENITLLLDFLETNDFYSRLYSLQLLSAILSARTGRTEECILTAPMGIPRLVAILDDRREAVRDEAITLITELTPASIDIQKLVAFEKGFERVFGIITDEGGLVEGARVVEDCLILLANLLRLNSSNQSMFREMGFIAGLGRLLKSAYQVPEDGQEIAQWAEAQRNRNIYALLAVIRLFLVSGAVGTPQNQLAFLNDRVLENTLQLAFAHNFELPIKSEALITCADMIRGNARLQETFAGLKVPSPLDSPTVGQGPQANGVPIIFVIDGLLDLILAVNAPQAFDMRMAACTCLKAYFFNHKEIRQHFLSRAIAGHKAKADELTNVLTTLLYPLPEALVADPYRFWFASVLMLHLVHESPATKALAMGVTEGDEANGEEVVTSIQTIAAHLLSSVAKSEDPRIIIGYLMLLLCWLFEDLDAVNDFLGEFTNLQGLIQAAVENPNGDVIVQGLSAMLAGVIYEFSTKDSPVPRATVREMIMTRMGRDRYVDKLSRLRSYPLMRDHEVLAQRLDSGLEEKLPDVFLDDTFVNFFKDNYSRILRAIDREPGLEISVVTNGVQKGISRELVDSLRAQVEEKERALQDIDVVKASLTSQLGQEQADHRRTKDTSAAELARANAVAESLRTQLSVKERALHEAEGKIASLTRQLGQEQAELQRAKTEISRLRSVNDGLQRNQEQELAAVRVEHRSKKDELRKQVDSVRRAAELDAERARRRSEAEKADLKATISRLEVDLMKANKARSTIEAKVSELEAKIKASAESLGDVEKRLKASEDGAREVNTQLEKKEEERKAAQDELDDLLIVFSDLEEKVTKYKDRLKSLGEAVSDGEDDEDGDDNEEDEEEE